jgi:hypothetical protein
MRGGDGVNKENMMKRLKWSMEQNSNQWLTANSMVRLLLTHRDKAVNIRYSKDVGIKIRPPPSLFNAPCPLGLIAIMKKTKTPYQRKMAKRNANYESGGGQMNVYRMKVKG